MYFNYYANSFIYMFYKKYNHVWIKNLSSYK